MIPIFRAWDKVNEEMLNVDIIDLFLEEIRVLKDDGTVFAMKFRNIELMQSTGLKDKNGVEIYEGDILLNTASENQEDWKKWRVHYADDRFLIDYKQIPKDKRKRKNLELEDLCEDNVWIYGLEVIGNIYENPELLENKESKKWMENER